MSSPTNTPSGAQGSRVRAFGWVALAYVAAACVAAAVVAWCPLWVPGGLLGRLAAADVAATVVVFGFSVRFDNSSFYDAYWSVAPMVIAPYLASLAPAGGDGRCTVILLLVAAWGLRLTWNWARGWAGLGHEDWRYRDIRAATGRWYWPASLGGIHLFPTVLVLLGCLPLVFALTRSAAPFGPLDALGAIVTGGAIVIEGVADNQLRRFVLSRPPAGTVLDTGLWRYARHPNYFGELSFWWGLAILGWASGAMPGWGLSGALAMTALFVFISGPMLDRRSLARRPGYADHMRRTSMLVPLPRRRR